MQMPNSPAEDNLEQDTRKKRLEADALERSAKTEVLKLLLSAIAALGFVFAFAVDRYKTVTTRTYDRKVAVVSEVTTLLRATDDVFVRIPVAVESLRASAAEYKLKLVELQRLTKASGLAASAAAEIAKFATESAVVADALMTELPKSFEYEAWAAAARAEQTWGQRASAIRSQIARDFDDAAAQQWDKTRESAVAALRSHSSFVGASEARDTVSFRASATAVLSSLTAQLK